MNKRYLLHALVVLTLCCVATSACSGSEKKNNKDTITLANPASVKCLKDGYKLKTMTINGVPGSSVCFNPRTGKQCEIWQYFRGECNLQ